ncbi:DUF1294 domain-containing protein [Thalassotalea crassostreae]|uniref:DUF1294 domain-containing protein n=1 Tax=Thalassotalea crassostreae TaxID=1763536 RepID=UPI0008381DA0|nr:DUF1294 domain-containing protein [Thalassotalea crassostreae]
MRHKGKLTQWNDDKGFGFITPMIKGPQVFVHIKDFEHRGTRPVVGQVITYQLSKDKQNRPCAIKATLSGQKLKTKSAQKQNTVALLFASSFMVAIIGLVAVQWLPWRIGAAYAVLSVITFWLYAFDKHKAQKGYWRTSERSLHLFALVGGWPGAVFAQQKLRHKSKKLSFRVELILMVLLNIAGLYWLYDNHWQVLGFQF